MSISPTSRLHGLILVCVISVAACGATLALAALVPKSYVSTADLLVRVSASQPSANLAANSGGEELLDTDAMLVESGPVRALVRKRLGYAAAVAVSTSPANDILSITATSRRPADAAAIANAYATATVRFLRAAAIAPIRLEQRALRLSLARAVALGQPGPAATLTDELVNLDLVRVSAVPSVTVASDGQTPTSASEPRLTRDILAAGITGLVLGSGAISARRKRSTSRSAIAFPYPGMKVLGGLPLDKSSQTTVCEPTRGALERITNLLLLGPEFSGVQRIVIVSPRRGEGRTRAVALLCNALAHRGKNIIALSTDPCATDLERWFPPECTPDAVAPRYGGNIAEPLPPTKDAQHGHVRFLPSSEATMAGTPNDALWSANLAELSHFYDYLIYDSPAALSSANVLPDARVDLAIVLVDVNLSRPEDVMETCERLRVSGTERVAILLNRTPFIGGAP